MIVSDQASEASDQSSSLAKRLAKFSIAVTQSSVKRSNTPIPQSGGVLIVDSELSLGELDSYPLRRASKICKATGGGRWEPKPIPEYVAKRIPGCKAAYELELEREEEERRIRRANPVIRNGDQLSSRMLFIY